MQSSLPSTQVRVILEPGQERVFTKAFRIGRESDCELVIDSGLVSRIHARVEVENGHWIVKDLGSTNGTYVAGERVKHVPLSGFHEIQFGINGPVVGFRVESAPKKTSLPVEEAPGAAQPPSRRFFSFGKRAALTARPTLHDQPSISAPKSEGVPPSSMGHYIDHYFGDQDTPAGEHTQFIRTAFRSVQAQQKKRYTATIAAIALLSLLSVAFGFYQHQKRSQLEALAVNFFNANKQLDLQIVSLRQKIEETGVDMGDQLALIGKQRQENNSTYDGYIRELGLYRKLTEKEQAIYDMARIFNESGFGMPASFVGEVMNKIDNFWLGSHRDRYVQAIQRAEQQGYTSYIVRAMHKRGLPPEFFYLALQESDLRVDQYGPNTRWGIAKGMWQFIPPTGTRFGLKVGPRYKQRVYDQLDERHDFYKSTDAAARYLQEIYGTLAQASGLLVMASYNWGEHRISDKLSALPGKRPLREEIFEGIPEDPDHRNYWAFLTEYKNRMPEETKDYVLKIFAAAVIGHNPRLWGLDMDNPLQLHMEGLPQTDSNE